MELCVSRVVPKDEAKWIKFAGHEMPSEFSMEFDVLDLLPGWELPKGPHVDVPIRDERPVGTVFASGSVEIGYRGGRPLCHRLVVDHGHGGIRGETLRAIPMAELVKVAVMIAMRSVRSEPSPLPDQEFDDFVSNVTTALDRHRRPLNPNVAAAARIYREALAVGKKPGPTIAKELHMTHASARRLVHQARLAGLLGGSLGQGRLGEQTPPPSN